MEWNFRKMELNIKNGFKFGLGFYLARTTAKFIDASLTAGLELLIDKNRDKIEAKGKEVAERVLFPENGAGHASNPE